MRKSELISALTAIPGDPEVFDWDCNPVYVDTLTNHEGTTSIYINGEES